MNFVEAVKLMQDGVKICDRAWCDGDLYLYMHHDKIKYGYENDRYCDGDFFSPEFSYIPILSSTTLERFIAPQSLLDILSQDVIDDEAKFYYNFKTNREYKLQHNRICVYDCDREVWKQSVIMQNNHIPDMKEKVFREQERSMYTEC